MIVGVHIILPLGSFVRFLSWGRSRWKGFVVETYVATNCGSWYECRYSSVLLCENAVAVRMLLLKVPSPFEHGFHTRLGLLIQ
jgi:hypothetical protein